VDVCEGSLVAKRSINDKYFSIIEYFPFIKNK
jgi:5'(3')-deoxyribonucleotidase